MKKKLMQILLGAFAIILVVGYLANKKSIHSDVIVEVQAENKPILKKLKDSFSYPSKKSSVVKVVEQNSDRSSVAKALNDQNIAQSKEVVIDFGLLKNYYENGYSFSLPLMDGGEIQVVPSKVVTDPQTNSNVFYGLYKSVTENQKEELREVTLYFKGEEMFSGNFHYEGRRHEFMLDPKGKLYLVTFQNGLVVD